MPAQIIQIVCGASKAFFLDYYGGIYIAHYDGKKKKDGTTSKRLWLYDRKKRQIGSLIKLICYCEKSGYMVGIDSSLWYISHKFHEKITDDNILDKKIKHISCGFDFVILIMEDHSIWVRGSNVFGQLALGNFLEISEFTPLITDEIFISVSCGYNFSLFLTRTQNVYSCGSNEFGQLGIGESKGLYPDLHIIDKLCLISNISCSFYSSYCVDIEGNLFTFGNNQNGELGLGDTIPRFEPEKVNGIPSIHHISNGHGNCKTIRDNKGDIWITGLHETSLLSKPLVTKFTKLNKKITRTWYTGDESKFNSYFEELDDRKKNYVSCTFNFIGFSLFY